MNIARLAVAALATGSIVVLTAASPALAASEHTTHVLRAMAAEEKLAHDVYSTLAKRVDLRPLDRIARSETQHLSLVRTAMAANGVSDQTAGDGVGIFDDPNVQRLYDRLVAQGSAGATAATAVGVVIEQMDIDELDKALAASLPADVESTLDTLRSGSERHLAAFSRWT